MAKRYAKSIFRMDDETVSTLVVGTPEIIKESAHPVLLDEWQAAPSIWNTVRHFVDENMEPGQYLLTGSSAPKKAKLHSGAGRIVRLKMRPFSLQERGLAPSLLSLGALLEDDADIKSQAVEVPQQAYVKEILCSGFPGVRQVASEYHREILDRYIDTIIEKDFSELGFEVRYPETLRAWMKAYAAAEGSTTSYESIMNAATPGQDKKPAKATTMVYREALEALCIIDSVKPWLAEGNLYRNLAKAPKHYLVDPALSARLLGVTEDKLLQGERVQILGAQTKTLIGRLFEGLVAQSLKVYAGALGLPLCHIRTTRGDHEVDFVIEKGNTLIALEVKFSPKIEERDGVHLDWLERNLPGKRVIKIVVYSGKYLVRQEQDKTIFVPAACLGV